jgi:hypothetical protein|tara:strand:- start:243 stop:386 length:144 start_codon:yes stop_codon:yes gene_type:complete
MIKNIVFLLFILVSLSACGGGSSSVVSGASEAISGKGMASQLGDGQS